jgi:hypothetical protein
MPQIGKTLAEIVDIPLLLDYSLKLLENCHELCAELVKTLSPTQNPEDDALLTNTMQLPENAEQKAKLRLWTKVIGVTCET